MTTRFRRPECWKLRIGTWLYTAKSLRASSSMSAHRARDVTRERERQLSWIMMLACVSWP